MTLTVTHSTVATAADDPSAEINKAEWNDDHVIVGGVSIVDLGVVDVADLLAGPVTLYTPGAGELVLTLFIADPMATDTGTVRVAAGETLTAEVSTSGNANGTGMGPGLVASPIVATLYDGNGHPVKGAWAAATAYASNDGIIANGTVWNADADGTSGGSEPDWAANAGSFVSDGGVDWYDTTIAPPATGSAHFYALVATP